MKRRITLILILMSACVAGIIGLQLFWNYQNYKNTVKTFDHDINEALQKAVDREISLRHQKLITKFKGWLADTSFVQITCNNKNRDSSTAFTLKDTHPYEKGEKGTTLGIASFKEKLKQINPKAKRYFIEHFGNNILKADLQKGIIYFYTQRLGDSLSKAYDANRLDRVALSTLYREELSSRGIDVPFGLIVPTPSYKSKLHLTQMVNTALRRPYQKEFISAAFESPDSYFIREMKWLIVTSFLLIAITLFCFAYTVRTLLSQHKLALLKDDFINNMTHEINTPLASISITAEALKKFDHDSQTTKEYLDIISYQTEKLTAFTAQILNAGRQANSISQNNEPVDIQQVLKQALYDLDPQIKNQKAVINFKPEQNTIHVHGETTSLLNAFGNIIDNALKYTDGDAKLDISVQKVGQYVAVMFADNGMGISPEYKERVFDKFFRVPKGNTHDVKGYGLGLSYVKQVIEQHGGNVSLVDNKPSGSIFTVKIPLDR